MPHVVEFTDGAKADLGSYRAMERKMVLSSIREQLMNEPDLESRNRKKLRDNPLARWEMRAGKHRIFYEVDAAAQTVVIIAVGHKEHNTLFIRGRRFEL